MHFKLKQMMNNKKKQAGSFILEAIISVLIFSIGILGLVAVAGQATNQVSQAKFRSDAGFLANDLIGQMLVSPTAPASFSFTDWEDLVEASLPNGVGSAEIDTTEPGNRLNIDIEWYDSKTASTHHHVVSTDVSRN